MNGSLQLLVLQVLGKLEERIPTSIFAKVTLGGVPVCEGLFLEE